jgi:glutathione peroxidase
MRLLIYLLLYAVSGGIYDLTLHTPAGETLNLSQFKGKKILIVNIASSSRWTNQLEHLEELQRRFDSSLVIIGVPSNSFSNEPLENEAISQWIADKRINFPVTEKSVVSGASQIGLYQWLQYPVMGDYQKYLVSEQGTLIGYFSSDTDPLNYVITNAISGK